MKLTRQGDQGEERILNYIPVLVSAVRRHKILCKQEIHRIIWTTKYDEDHLRIGKSVSRWAVFDQLCDRGDGKTTYCGGEAYPVGV